MPMTDDEREELLDEVMAKPLSPMQELMDKWIVPGVSLPGEILDEGPFDVVDLGGEYEYEESGLIADRPMGNDTERRLLASGVADLRTRTVAAAEQLSRRE